ncbi:MAG: Spy/CpxP family protein refolding chaperone [Candidatus Margulisbacteria bacterium]|nr:Spy/CpxP family protein refolding chaperone [Candidatus Margulisiibacteriota bacterium]
MKKILISIIGLLCVSGMLLATPDDKDFKGPNKAPDQGVKARNEMREHQGYDNKMLGNYDLHFLAEKLGLSKDQIKALRKAGAETEKVVIPLGIDRKMANEDLKEAYLGATLDENKIQQLQNTLLDNQKKMYEAILAGVKTARAILTPEQLKKLSELKSEKKNWKSKKEHK